MERFLVFGAFFVCVFASFVFGAGGDMGIGTDPKADGSAEHPWLIEDFADFEVFCDSSSPEVTHNYWENLHVKLMCDIDLSPSIDGRQIYNSPVVLPDAPYGFKGHLDGNEHTISNLTIDDSSGDGAGYLSLFWKIWKNASVINLGLENVSLSRNEGSAAGFVGINYGLIDGCYVTGSITCQAGYSLGGIASENTGTITNCYYTGSISGAESSIHCGGIAGFNYGSITNSYSTASISGETHLGGIAGRNQGFISECHTSGNMTPESDINRRCGYAGGLVGYNEKTGSIVNCYSEATLGGRQFVDVGGLVGRQECDSGEGMEYGTVDCYSTGNVNGEASVGGLIGGMGTGLLRNSYSTGEVTGTYFLGGFVGINRGSIDNCRSSSKVFGYSGVGGFAGINNGQFDYCYSTGKVTGSSDTGGFVGRNDVYNGFGTISNSFSTGEVFGDMTRVGGFSGANDGKIEQSFCSGNVNGEDHYVGGFTGMNSGEIANSYCKGNVICNGGGGGGFLGASLIREDLDYKISNCYCLGLVTGTADSLGGFCGFVFGSTVFESCFWNITVNGGLSDHSSSADLDSVEGLSSNDMMISLSYTGWDFVGELVNGDADVWRLCVDGSGYPRLAWEYARVGDFVCGDGVDMDDFAYFAGRYDFVGCIDRADLDGDGVVGVLDLAEFCSHWLDD